MNGPSNHVFNMFEDAESDAACQQGDQRGNEDRIRALEQRVELQEDEITLLKSSLSDVIRRLKDVETSSHYGGMKKPSPLKNTFHPLPSRPHIENSPRPRARPPSPGLRKRIPSSKDDGHKMNGNSGDLRRAPSTDQLNRDNKRSSFRSKKSSGNGKQPTFNAEDASVRMHLKGRPVVLYKPTDIETSYNINSSSALPDNKLKLEWVYGYRGRDCRSNLYSLPTGEIVYFVAAVVVLYDPKDGYQRHYLGHNDDVKCIAIHPDKLKIATGQVAGLELDGREFKHKTCRKPRLPQVHIWDAVSLTTLHVLDSFDRSVACLSFSKADGGAMLGVVDESNDHVLSVWNWQKEVKITEAKSSKDQVLLCEFNPQIQGSIVSCGKNHINFWSLEGGQLVKKQGLFERHEKPKYILCLGFTANGDVISGDSSGNVQVWTKGRKIAQILESAHDGPVFCICAIRDGFITGGKDGGIKKWSENLQTVKQTQLPEESGSVRTIASNDKGQLLVGTKKNSILLGDFEADFQTIVHGHVEELWCLAVHPSKAQFLTGAYDKQLVMWDATNHTSLWFKTFDDGIQSASFYPCDNNIIAVGMTTGRWLILDSSNLELITVHTDGNEQHDVIKFSPDGKFLAIGSHDNMIYIYNVSDDGRKYNKHGKLSGHSSYITHFDWSADSQNIQSNSGDYELLYWDVQSCRQMTSAPSMRDIEWATQSCTLGFTVLGVWPEGADGTDINSVARSTEGKLLASGDDFGKVHLFKYPAVQPRVNLACLLPQHLLEVQVQAGTAQYLLLVD
uniref:echinoderm microtubule-associated protein-like 2 isoform X4 n=1 Tax=Ciona intestinalis TaxID=7719 RepID=UPI000EF524CF|nr:echinoderm microtubule-associated protein-like 2 isoform X4 [Ciona intestinalis]|eukprot:XP_026693817.1 echinoderm microtubule-associated protein-like 2 isoform X4 [Ciona intestinalis]